MKKPKIRKVYLKILAILPIPFLLTGCFDADCKIPDYHIHKYVGKIRRGYKGYPSGRRRLEFHHRAGS